MVAVAVMREKMEEVVDGLEGEGGVKTSGDKRFIVI